MKVASNLMVRINSLGAAEALLLAERSRIDPRLFLDTAATNAGSSFMLSYLGPTIARREKSRPNVTLTPALRGLVKDQELVSAAASEAGISLTAGRETMEMFQASLAGGSGEGDIASILLTVEKLTQE